MAEQGQTRTRVEEKDKRVKDQGPKTREKHREMTRSGSPDQGTK